jgi:hypothetical protein
MVDEMRGSSRRIADGNPAFAQGANDEPFQDSSGNYVLKWLEVPTKQIQWRLILQVVTACFATPPGGLLKEAQLKTMDGTKFGNGNLHVQQKGSVAFS